MKLGPNDADMSLVVDDNNYRLFACNGGSNTIAVFDINTDGTLTAVSGSPFPSGGRQPVSLDVRGSKLYAVNKNEDTLQFPNSDLPNYVTFNIAGNGALSQTGSTINTLSKASPAQALVSRDGSLLFGADFLVPMTHPGTGGLRTFMTGGSMGLSNASGSPFMVPGDPMTALPLGIWEHPEEEILYIGHPARNKVGVYTYTSAGALNYVTEVNNSGAAPCWNRTSADGDALYTLNSLSNTVSFYDLSDPMAPVETQHFSLSQPGPMFTNVLGMSQTTSGPFFEELSPDGRFLYTVNQRQDYNSPSQEGNNIHILSISGSGQLAEPFSPVSIPVPATMRPVGLVVL